MKRVLTSCFLFLITAGAFLLSAAPVSAKSYTIDKVDVQANISPNGSMSIQEARTYDYDGSFSFAYQTIKKKPDASKNPGRDVPYKISNFRLCDEDTCYRQSTNALENASSLERLHSFYVNEEADQYYVKWFYDTTGGQKTFTLYYTVENAITLQQDVAELYWQWIGDEWDHAQSNISVDVTLPAGIPDDQVQAWAHGPSTGRVSIPTADNVLFTLDRLPKETFFEGRIITPKTTFTAGAPGALTKAQITRQENDYIRDTIARIKQQQQIAIAFGGANILFIIFTLGFFFKSFFDFWKNHKEAPLPKVNHTGTLWEPPSELSPSQVEQLLNAKKSLTPKSFIATVLNLVHRRYFKFVRSDQKHGLLFKDWKYYLIPLDEQPIGKLTGVELKVYRFIRDTVGEESVERSDGSTFTAIPLDSIVKYCKQHPSSTQLFFEELESTALRANLSTGYFDTHANKNSFAAPAIATAVVSGCFAFLTTFAIQSGVSEFARLTSFVSLAVAAFVFFVMIILLDHKEKRTIKGAQEAANWKAFKKHISDYNTTSKYPIDSIILWEKYLIYGSLLGVSVKALSQLPVKFSHADQRLASSYWAGFSAGSSGGFDVSMSSLSSALGSLSSSVTSSYGASGAGSSGGASGGGLSLIHI